jgi:hypothetical protein
MRWLRERYADFRFFSERDLVWTVQRRLAGEIERQSLPYRVFNDYPPLPGKYRRRSADIVLVPTPITPPGRSPAGKWAASPAVAVAVEFKYEPSHARDDIWPTKLPVVMWAEVLQDITRLYEFIEQERALVAYALFVDESGTFRHRAPALPGDWQDWERSVAVHWAKVTSSSAVFDTANAGPP